MVFHSSPALRRIRQLARLIRNHPDLPGKPQSRPLPDRELPDPELFVDSSVTKKAPGSHRPDANMRRKRINSAH